MVVEVYILENEISRFLSTWKFIVHDNSFIDDLIFFLFFPENFLL